MFGLAFALPVSCSHLVAVFGSDSMSNCVEFVVYKVEIGEVFLSDVSIRSFSACFIALILSNYISLIYNQRNGVLVNDGIVKYNFKKSPNIR